MFKFKFLLNFVLKIPPFKSQLKFNFFFLIPNSTTYNGNVLNFQTSDKMIKHFKHFQLEINIQIFIIFSKFEL